MLQTKSGTKVYHGKVRDVFIYENHIFIVVSDRISAFDVILPRLIPYKGAVLNGISTFFLEHTKHLVPNWLISSPNSHVAFGHYAPTIPIEVIVRGYMAGSMWRAYEKGERIFCGNKLPDGLQNFQKLPEPIITPTTKAAAGHDEDTSEIDILAAGLVSKDEWNLIKKYTLDIYQYGSEYALERGLILVDTKMEYGKKEDGTILLIDEILTPDSSRYFIQKTYQERIEAGLQPDQLSKEFVRQWLIDQGFMGRSHDTMPALTEEWAEGVSLKYIELYNLLLGIPFDKSTNQYNIENIQNIYNELHHA